MVNKYIVEFNLTNGEIISEERDSEKDIKEFNKQIAQFVVVVPIYTLIKGDIAINIMVSQIVNFNIKIK